MQFLQLSALLAALGATATLAAPIGPFKAALSLLKRYDWQHDGYGDGWQNTPYVNAAKAYEDEASGAWP